MFSMDRGVFIEDLGHDDCTGDGNSFAIAVSTNGGHAQENNFISVVDVGHGDGYEPQLALPIIVERISDTVELSYTYVERFASEVHGGKLPNLNLFSALPLMLITLLTVFALWLRRWHSRDRTILSHATTDLASLDTNLADTKKLIADGRLWSQSNDLSKRLESIVDAFSSQLPDPSDSREFRQWLRRAEDITSLFQRLLFEKMSGYINISKRQADIQDEKFLICLGHKYKSIFEIFHEQRRLLVSSCPEHAGRVQSTLMQACECHSVRAMD